VSYTITECVQIQKQECSVGESQMSDLGCSNLRSQFDGILCPLRTANVIGLLTLSVADIK